MSMIIRTETASRVGQTSAWIPLTALPILVLLVSAERPRWLFMWSLALSIYCGFKWLSFAGRSHDGRPSTLRAAGYLLLWPGMDADAFLSSRRFVPAPRFNEWLLVIAKIIVGITLLVVVTPLAHRNRLLAGWTGMVGIVFIVHFGLFHVLSLCWRQFGIDAQAIMNAPIKSSSLCEFWGQRWNIAFRDLAHAHVFRPLVRRSGVSGATMATFLVSGAIHDLVISVPARAGFGLPTIYFVIQGLGVLAERSRFAKRIGLGRGVIGWFFCVAVTTMPVCLLFHRPFIERIILPMLTAFHAT